MQGHSEAPQGSRSKTAKPLFFKDDDDFVRDLIYELIRRKRYVRRESKYHIKVRDVNYWPSTRTITIDGAGRHPEKGAKAFVLFAGVTIP